MQASNTRDPKLTLQIYKLVWLAMVAAVFVYGLVLFVITQKSELTQDSIELNSSITMGLALVAVLNLVAAYVLPKIIYKTAQRERGAAQSAASLGGVHQQKLTAEEVQGVFIPFLLRVAFLESVALFGFIAAFMSKDIQYYALFAAPAVFGLILSFPSETNLKKLTK